MTIIQLQISDDIIQAYGLEAIQQRLMHYLEWERLYLAAKEIQSAVEEASLDNDQLWEQARQTAWEHFIKRQIEIDTEVECIWNQRGYTPESFELETKHLHLRRKNTFAE